MTFKLTMIFQFQFGLLLCFFFSGVVVLGNVEKAIFLGPERTFIPTTPPTLEDLGLDVLTPGPHRHNWWLRTQLQSSFPTTSDEEPKGGTSTWLLLDNLVQGQRYEVRVCWPATQPTAFTLHTYDLQSVWDSPALITSLYNYTMSRQDLLPDDLITSSIPRSGGEREASVLLLQILSAADYFTHNETLMSTVPAVDVDIILDPFLLNVLPRSLLPTAGFIVFIAVIAYGLSRRVLAWIQRLSNATEDGQEKKQQ
ncbi:hypothetical protein QBC46DRAFT_444501 [Diplogelasinospora grovesii]|uniref:Uncharacterized protein n=1 Tax=Diplogelasinospora grovesii TaxID=303347 RepID=A0AAN6SAT3_9PEZI|nr:hypothetical protein QBC46DRAFT_444501 [Diplogelasinospora grovesii]